jgi:hypothetical protein
VDDECTTQSSKKHKITVKILRQGKTSNTTQIVIDEVEIKSVPFCKNR